MTELKPCPYCGNKKVILLYDPLVKGYFVECNLYACNRIYVDYFETAEDAVESWNRGKNDNRTSS